MTALAARRILLVNRDGNIGFRAPEGSLDDELREAIKRNKEGLASALERRQGFVQLCPLSNNQLSMFFLHLFDPKSPAYNLALTMRVRATLDPDKLRKALALLAQRHEQLRATFSHVFLDNSAVPCQLIAERLAPILEEYDARSLSEDELHGQAQAFYAAPLDLGNGPAVLAGLFWHGETDHVLVVKLHHIVADGWSINLILRDLGRYYHDIDLGCAIEEQVFPVAYSKFSIQQRDSVSLPEGRAHLTYWQNLHTPVAAALELGRSKPRPVIRRSVGATRHFLVDPAFQSRLDDCARKLGITTFALLLGVFQAFLFRRSRQNEVVVGIPTLGHRSPEFQNTVGYFVNPIAVRSHRERPLSFREHAQLTARELAEGLDHRDTPFAALVERLGGARDLSRTPVFQVMFHLLSKRMLGDAADLLYPCPVETNVDFGGLAATGFPLNQQEGQFDLTLEIIERGKDMLGLFKYCTDLFEPEEVTEMISDFRGLLECAVSDPENFVVDTPLGKMSEEQPPAKAEMKVVVAATFTAEAFRELLEYWFDRLGWRTEITFDHYNQVFQALLDPTSVLRQNRHGFGVIMIRFDDFLGMPLEGGLKAEGAEESLGKRLASNLDELVGALAAGAPAMHVPLCVGFCPSSPKLQELMSDEVQLRERTVDRLRSIQGVRVLTPEDVFRWYPVEQYYEPLGEELGHIPYTQDCMAALATSVVRLLYAIVKKPVKAIAVDCDGTLWSGVVGEDGADGVIMSMAHLQFQEFLVEQHRAGVVLCLCSKNQASDVWSVFDRNPGMPLKREYISFWRINWQSKSVNLREIAAEINIEPNAIAFLDDNPVEREEVRANCPSVLCAELPEDPAARLPYLRHFWPLDHGSVTEEDRRRGEYYWSERQRSDLLKGTGSFADFLERLQLVVDVHRAGVAEYQRMSQLSIRTSQFNSTARVFTLQEVAEYNARPGHEAFVTRVRDRFGDYGIVGAMLVSKQDSALSVDSLLLSCRALGRGVEHRMAVFLARHASASGCAWVDYPIHVTNRNEPVRAFLHKLLESCSGSVNEKGTVRVSTDQLAAVRYIPEEGSSEKQTGKKMALDSTGEIISPVWESRVTSIASEIQTVRSIRSASREWRRQRQLSRRARTGGNGTPTLPASDAEKMIAETWKNSLAVDDIGTGDNFFEIGGTSILLAQVAVELKRRGMEVSLVDLFQYPTISALARHLSCPESQDGDLDSMATAGRRQRAMVEIQQLPAVFERLKRHRGK